MDTHGLNYAEIKPEAEIEWTDFAHACAAGVLTSKVSSWFTGVNSNVDGKDKPSVTLYMGSAKDYRLRCDRAKQGHYQEFSFDRPKESRGGAPNIPAPVSRNSNIPEAAHETASIAGNRRSL
jgi:hypothetical protein